MVYFVRIKVIVKSYFLAEKNNDYLVYTSVVRHLPKWAKWGHLKVIAVII